MIALSLTNMVKIMATKQYSSGGERVHQRINFPIGNSRVLEILSLIDKNGVIASEVDLDLYAGNNTLITKKLEDFDAQNPEHRKVYKNYLLTGNISKKYKVKPPHINLLSMMQEEMLKYYTFSDQSI